MRFLLIPCSLFPLHSLVFSDVPRLRFQSSNLRTAQEVHSFALSKMSSCVSNPCQIFLRKKCVAVRILSISCSLLLLHCFGPSKIPCYQSRDLRSPQQVHSFALSIMISRTSLTGQRFLHKKDVDVRLLSI